MASGFKKLSEVISVSTSDEKIILVNNEWTFRVPSGYAYKTDSKFDGGLQTGVDLSGDIKPLVIKGLKTGTKYLFNFGLQEHLDLFGNYYSITDCKYDNRVLGSNSGVTQKIVTDTPDFYVDIITENIWPFGVCYDIRVRSSNGTPFDFRMFAKGLEDYEVSRVKTAMKEVASSIKPAAGIPKQTPGGSKTVKATGTVQNDPNCIVEGTTLRKYIGKNTAVVLPGGIKEIADNTFSGSRIRSIVVPEGVKTIGRRVFENCFELEEAVLPSSLKDLGGYSFVDCHKLKTVTLGRNLSYISDSLFSECYELENVVIPNKVKSIEAFAFKNCRKFTSIVIPNGVTTIGFTAFAYCTNLSYLYMPASVTNILDNFMDQTPFEGCQNLTVHCPAGSAAEDYCKTHGIKYITDNNPKKVTARSSKTTVKPAQTDKTANNKMQRSAAETASLDDFVLKKGILSEYKGTARDVVIPEGVTTIKRRAFYKNEYIESVVISEGVTEIGKQAFRSCKNLRRVVLPDTLRMIDDEAFYLCGSLESIDLKNCEQVGESVFHKCESMKTARWSDKLKEPGKSMFYDCKSLENISAIPKHWTQIPTQFLTHCKRITSVSLHEGITKLGIGCFAGCGIRNIVLPKSLKTIEFAALADCPIRQIEIPEGVSEIGSNCFRDCKELERIVIPGSVRNVSNRLFFDCDKLEKVILKRGIRTIGEEAIYRCKAIKSIDLPDTIENCSDEAFQASSIERVWLPKGYKAETIRFRKYTGYSSYEKGWQYYTDYSQHDKDPDPVCIKVQVCYGSSAHQKAMEYARNHKNYQYETYHYESLSLMKRLGLEEDREYSDEEIAYFTKKDELEQKKDKLLNELKKNDEERRKHEQAVSTARISITNNEQQISAHQTEIMTRERLVQNHKNKIASLTVQIDELKQSLKRYDNTELEAEIDKLQYQQEAKNREFSALSGFAIKKKKALKQEIEELQNQLFQKKRKKIDNEQSLRAMQRLQITPLEKSIMELTLDEQNEEKRKTQAENAIKRLNNQIEDADTRIQSHMTYLKTLRQQRAETEERIKETETELSQLQQPEPKQQGPEISEDEKDIVYTDEEPAPLDQSVKTGSNAGITENHDETLLSEGNESQPPSAGEDESSNKKTQSRQTVKKKSIGLSYTANTYAIIDDKLYLPVPDGYHYKSEGNGVNANWCYIVPKDVPLTANHIDAKPFSFGVTTQSGKIPFDAENIEVVKLFFIEKGFLDGNVMVDQFICSKHCAFLYQNWTDTADATYNKINGFLFAGDRFRQFHIYVNHNSEIAYRQSTIDSFLKAAAAWMKKVYLDGDEAYKKTVPAGSTAEVRDTIRDLSTILRQASEKLPIPAGAEKDLKKIYAVTGALFYVKNGLQLNGEAGRLLAQMVDEVDGSPMNGELLKKLLKESRAEYGSISDCMKAFSNTYLVNQLVKCDKITKSAYDKGITIIHHNGIKELLLVLCSKNGIDFTDNAFCRECLDSLNEVIEDKWNSTSIMMF